jgi:copper resistance protein B
MTGWVFRAGALATALLAAGPAIAEPLIYGIQVEQAERRFDEGSDVYAWDVDALIGTDELKVVWRSEAEYRTRDKRFETLENQFRLQAPVSDFFDAVAGVRVDTPRGEHRAYAVVGIHGLAPQWFEVDADLFVGETSFVRFEVEYEGLITNRLILTPSLEIDLPLGDDDALGVGGFGPTLEVGARLSYDLVDRAVSPYIGVHYERAFGETADRARAEGEERDALFLVVGTKVLF